MRAEDMHAGLDAIALDKQHLKKGLGTILDMNSNGNVGSLPGELPTFQNGLGQKSKKYFRSTPKSATETIASDNSLAELDRLLAINTNAYDVSHPAPGQAISKTGLVSPRFSQVHTEAGSQVQSTETAAMNAEQEAESAIAEVMALGPEDRETASGHLPHYGALASNTLPASQQSANSDVATDFLVAQGIINPATYSFMQKPKKKMPLNIRDEQVVSQTFAKAQSTLARLQRTSYGMAQEVRALNMVELQLQRTLGYLGDQEFNYGGFGR